MVGCSNNQSIDIQSKYTTINHFGWQVKSRTTYTTFGCKTLIFRRWCLLFDRRRGYQTIQYTIDMNDIKKERKEIHY